MSKNCLSGLDNRCRDNDGEIRHKNGATRVGTLRQTYGNSFAFGVLHAGRQDDPIPRKIGADAWFDRWEAEKYVVQEQTIRTGADEVLTLVLITDPEMLEDDR